MAESDAAANKSSAGRMQDFIFARELSEVYLLLDHVSGRADKTLAAAERRAEAAQDLAAADPFDMPDAPPDWIERICKIGWPAEGTTIQQAEQAATLLRAKDRLNAAAKPASGMTIAFTVLVAGEDGERLARGQRLRGWLSGSRYGAGATAPTMPTPDRGWGHEAPSRTSLARLAYPGLIGTAVRFRRQIRLIIALLIGWLMLTCVLSWNITTGNSILLYLQSLAAQKADIDKKIADVETTATKRPDAGAPTGAAAKAEPVTRYCHGHLVLMRTPATADGVGEQFDSVTQRQICDQLVENRRKHAAANEDLADWLAIWRWLKGISHEACGGRCLDNKTATTAVTEADINEQWASILANVLGNAVLPVFYGILGAGAAIVRDLWGRMRDSLLSPRDVTLALGQLALGAVIGACIGLFVTPSNASPQEATGLTGSVTLSASALSFVAGFSVEGMFVALESFIKRVFNIDEPGRRR